jgi:NADPH:quinone reductase-like Zn-dependent oxidoreductase
MGASYLDRNVEALAIGGRLVIIGMQGGREADLDIAELMNRRASISASSLRSRPPQEKAALIASVRAHVWPLIESGAVRPVVFQRSPMPQAASAHRFMESSAHTGKILLLTP